MRIRPWWLFIACIVIIPYLGTHIYQKYRPSVDWEQSSEGLVVHMKENGLERILNFDTYVVGVLGAVLTPDTHEEMIKAMAVILRTYLYYMSENGKLLDGEQLNQPWLSAKERRIKGWDDEKIYSAIRATEGRIILFNEVPMLPLYCELSNGKTRNFSDVWNGNIEYLKSVESLWDKGSPNYIQKFQITKNLWQRAWGDNFSEGQNSPQSGGQMSIWQIQIVEKDNAGYVKQIQIGTEIYSGEEVRHRLGLSSACFEYEIKNNTVEFTCYGQGHGVGLSIYGANGMALEGKTWEEILRWYYPGTDIGSL